MLPKHSEEKDGTGDGEVREDVNTMYTTRNKVNTWAVNRDMKRSRSCKQRTHRNHSKQETFPTPTVSDSHPQAVQGKQPIFVYASV